MALERDVFVIGVGMHRISGAPTPVGDMAFDAGINALTDAGIEFDAVEALYNGYASGGMTAGVTLAKDFGLTGVPVTHVENASATGSSAFREAVLSVAGGHARCAMALGFDPSPGATANGGGAASSRLLSSFFRPSVEGVLLPAAFFALWAVRRMHDAGTTVETYARIAAKNWNHARLNPYAQRQADHRITVDEVLGSTMIAYPHTSMMAAAVGGGAACAIVADRELAEQVRDRTGYPLVQVISSRLESERYTPGHIFMGAVVGPSELTRTTSQAAYEEASLGPADLDLVHVHDAFPVEELLYYELLGICGDGEGDKLVAEGATEIGGRIPFSTDGGLIGRGHPVGPTGLAQIWDTTVQLRGQAGDRQVEGARTGLAHMMGAGSVCIIHVLQRR
ncbi:MAG TPA: thiolase family protein [Acidimicrobiales bacterium]|nr:thiolase family protein [Acidimicrobiales bacterium]